MLAYKNSSEFNDMTSTRSVRATILTTLSAAIIFLLCISNVHTEELKVFTEEMPPYNYTNDANVVTGFSTEIVQELIKRTKSDIFGKNIRSLPWARAYKMLQQEPNILLFSMTRSEERENLFKWVGPIASRTIWFWKLKSRKDISVKTLDDIKLYRTGAVREFSSTRYMQELNFTLDLTNSEELNFKKLIAGRFDLLTALELAAAYHMKKQGKNFDQLERVIKLDDRYNYYLALNINTSDEIVQKLQSALDEMKTDGSYERIKTLYLK